MAKQKAGKVDIKATMAHIDKFFNKAKKRAIEAGDTALPEYDDGRYIARLMSATLCKSASSSRDQVDFAWKFVDGEYAGKTKHAYNGIETDQNFEYFLRDLKRLGFEIDELDSKDIPDLLDGIGKTKPHLLCQIVLKTKNDFQNVYINSLLEDDDEETEEAEASKDDEDDDDDTKARAKKAKKVTKPAEEEEDEEEEEEEEKPAKKVKKVKPAAEEEEEEDPAPKKKKAKPVKEEEEEEEDDDDDDDEEEEEQLHISVGSEVIVETKDGQVKATILEMFPDEQKIRVETEDGKKLRLPAERVVSLVEKTTKKAKKK
jgi:sRNA-binding protein